MAFFYHELHSGASGYAVIETMLDGEAHLVNLTVLIRKILHFARMFVIEIGMYGCLLYTSDAADEL